jgi:hypothetical protein
MKCNPISILFVLLFLFTGCLKEQEDFFPNTSSERLTSTIESVDSLLISASNGWLMHYYADGESPGYSLIIAFNKNKEVIVAAQNELVGNTYSEARSFFDIIGDYGPVLTFNTYNDILHLFSNPVDPDGVGLGGDYEFVIISQADTFIHLEGKKRKSMIFMERLPEGISWSDYLSDVASMNDGLFGAEPLYIHSGSTILYAYGGASHIFQIYGFADERVVSMPFVVTRSGLRFYSVLSIDNNKNVQTFNLSTDGNSLIAREDINTFIQSVDVGDYLVDSHESFVFDTVKMSDHFKRPASLMCQQMKTQYSDKRNIDNIALSYDAILGHSFYFSTAPKVTEANFKINITADSNLSNRVVIEKVDGLYDSNGKLFLSSAPAINDFWQELEGSYNLTTSLSKKEIKFVDSKDDSRFFVVIRK